MKSKAVRVNVSKPQKKQEGRVDNLSHLHDLKVAGKELINSQDSNSRISAAYRLGNSGKEEVVEILHRALNLEDNEHVIDEILSSLGAVASPLSADELFNFLLSNENEKLRKKAIVILSFIPNTEVILDGVESLLLHEVDAGLRAEIVWLLGKIGKPESIKSLEKIIFFDPSIKVRKRALKALLKIKDLRVKEIFERALMEILDKSLRREILWHYTQIPDFDKKKLLRAFEIEEDFENQRLIVWSLARTRDSEIFVELLKSSDPNYHHSQVIKEINFKAAQFKDKFSQDHLLDILEFSPNPNIRQNAARDIASNLKDIDIVRLMRIKEQETDEHIKAELEQILRLV